MIIFKCGQNDDYFQNISGHKERRRIEKESVMSTFEDNGKNSAAHFLGSKQN